MGGGVGLDIKRRSTTRRKRGHPQYDEKRLRGEGVSKNRENHTMSFMDGPLVKVVSIF